MKQEELRFKKIYQQNYPKVVRLCMGYAGGDEAIAKDLAQETFVKVWQNLATFRKESSMSTWIYRISVNTCLAAIRKEKRNAVSFRAEQLEGYEEEPTETVNKELQLAQLYDCINTLNSTNKAIILLELEGVPQTEISEIIGMKHEAIRTRIHRIKEQLTKCVSNE